MENAGLVGLSRQIGLERAMDAIAQNVANMNTTGYKGERVRFREYIETPDPTAKVAKKIDFVIDQGMIRNLQPGSIQKTDNPLNVALAGDPKKPELGGGGFFAVQTPNGERYTRNGNFKLDVNGELQTQDGLSVLGANGRPINIPSTAGDITIAADGSVSATKDPTSTPFGQLRIVTFSQPQNLERQGDSLYMAYPANAPQIDTKPKVIQGALETSNVSAVTEMTRLIAVQRSYESAKNLIDTTNTMSQDAVKRLGQRAA